VVVRTEVLAWGSGDAVGSCSGGTGIGWVLRRVNAATVLVRPVTTAVAGLVLDSIRRSALGSVYYRDG
jgi:hypothetical protein